MPQYKMTINAPSITSLQAKLKKLGVDDVSIEKVNQSPSRADRLSEAESSFEDAKSTVTDLKDELQNWKDNLPENMQNGDKASQLDDAIYQLEEIENNLEQVDFGNVEFPSMMG